MGKDTGVQLRQPGTFSEGPLTGFLRLGARRLLARAVGMEVTAFVEGHADLTDEAGRRWGPLAAAGGALGIAMPEPDGAGGG